MKSCSLPIVDSPIRVDDESTWPEALCVTLKELFLELRAYELERERIDKLIQSDIILRTKPPANRYQHAHDLAVAACGEHLSGKNIIGFHCTRLDEDGITDVAANGLYTLSWERVADRIRKREAARVISSSLVHRLITENETSHSNRVGMVWFVFTAASLQDESGVGRLFSFWGGEALYGMHEHDEVTGSVLKSIGQPCVVEASLPVAEVQPFGSLEECLYAGFLDRRGVTTRVGLDMDGYVKCLVPGNRIRRIIRRASSEFLELTKCDSWSVFPIKQ